MGFSEILKEMVEGLKGGVAATLMGTDGLPVQQYAGAEYDIETVGIEYGKVVDEIKTVSTLLNLGTLEEVTVATVGNVILIKMVTPEYYIAYVVSQGANTGRARYLLRKAAAKAKKELLT